MAFWRWTKVVLETFAIVFLPAVCLCLLVSLLAFSFCLRLLWTALAYSRFFAKKLKKCVFSSTLALSSFLHYWLLTTSLVMSSSGLCIFCKSSLFVLWKHIDFQRNHLTYKLNENEIFTCFFTWIWRILNLVLHVQIILVF